MKVENITEMHESEIAVVWTRGETSPKICRKKDSADDTTWENKEARSRGGWAVSTETCMRAIGTTT